MAVPALLRRNLICGGGKTSTPTHNNFYPYPHHVSKHAAQVEQALAVELLLVQSIDHQDGILESEPGAVRLRRRHLTTGTSHHRERVVSAVATPTAALVIFVWKGEINGKGNNVS